MTVDLEYISERQGNECYGFDDWWYWEGWKDFLKGEQQWAFPAIEENDFVADFKRAYDLGYADAKGEDQ